MADNPYQSGPYRGGANPSGTYQGRTTASPQAQQGRGGGRERPIGIMLLAGLALLSGLVLLGALAIVLSQSAAAEAIGELGVYPPLLIGMMALVAGVLLGAGVGMWRGERWGWWLGAFMQVFSVVRNAAALVTVPGMEDPLVEESEDFQILLVRVIGRSVVILLLIGYFFRGNVLEYFRLEEVNRVVALVALVVVSAALIATVTGLNWLAMAGV
jgi:hypothetical protein